MRRSSTILIVCGALSLMTGCGGSAPSPSVRAAGESAARTVLVDFDEPPGIENEILSLGGLLIRASCNETGDGYEYLGVGARTTIDDTSRAVSLTLSRDAVRQTYAFRSGDFDRSDGWYDFAGTIPDPASGTLSYSRPDGGQVALTFKADQNDGCTFSGTARFEPPAPSRRKWPEGATRPRA